MFIIGVFLLASSESGITGNVISERVSAVSSIFSLMLVIGGVLVFMTEREKKEGGLEKNLAREILQNKQIILDPRKLRKIANKIAKQQGYSGREVKEGYQILDANGNPLTVIPHKNISRGVYYSIMEALATGESNFRKRTGYSSA